jgi:hypothetical protein
VPWLKWVIAAEANLAKRGFFVRAERCEYTSRWCALLLALQIARRHVCGAQIYAIAAFATGMGGSHSPKTTSAHPWIGPGLCFYPGLSLVLAG